MSELPSKWSEFRLGDVAEIIGGGTPKTGIAEFFSSEDGIPWITPADLSGYKSRYIARGNRFLTEQGFNASSARLMPKGTVLFSSRAPIGYVAIAANDISTNQGFKSLVPNASILPEFLYFYMRYATPLATERASGTTFLEISGKNMATIPVIVPPLNEQKRIVEKLEKLLGKVEAAQERLDKIPAILKRFRQSVLAAACSGKITADWRKVNKHEEWKTVRVEDFFKSYSGGTPSKNVPEYWNGPIGWLSSGDVKQDRIRHTSESITPAGLDNSSAKLCRKGSVVVVVRSGVLKHTLPIAIIDQELAINQDIKCFDSGDDGLNSWLAWCLRAAEIQILSENREGTTVQSVRYETLKSFELQVPSVEERGEIVRRVEELFKLADQIEERYKKARCHTDKLTQSILAKAFRGELVPQDPNDEPASVLLDRIKEQAQNKPKVPSNRNKKITRRKNAMKPIKKRTNVIDVLSARKAELSSKDLFLLTGHDESANPEDVESFFVDLRSALEANRIERTRRGDSDWFRLKETVATNK